MIYGSMGKDVIQALGGNDIIFGGAGDDFIEVGSGSNTVDGGAGFDTVSYAGSIQDYNISRDYFYFLATTVSVRTLATGDRDTLYGVEALYFAADDRTLYINGRNNAVIAGDDAFSTGEKEVLSLTTASLLANDWDFDGDRISFRGVSAQSTAGAGITLKGGALTYDPGDLFKFLNVGETATDTFTYTVDDRRGGVSTATVTITIHGENDAAVVTGATSGSVTEDGATGPGTPAATGKLTAADVDNDDGFQAGSGNAQYGSYTIDAEGNWRYDLDNDNADVEALDDGQTLTDEFTVLTRDGTQQTVTITINGADDTAIVAGDIAGAVTEVGVDVAGIEAATGQLTSTDNAFAPSSGATLYGSYSIDAEGNWRYELDNDNADVDALNDGQTLEDTFTVRSTTGTAQEVTITVHGANDAAVVSGRVSAAIGEMAYKIPKPGQVIGYISAISGQLTSEDVDNGNGFRAQPTTGTKYGSYNINEQGRWLYGLDNKNPAVDALNDGETLEDKFTVYTEDGTAQEVTVTINGANDDAVVTGATSGAVTEDDATGPGTPAATGKLTATDVDNDDGFRASSGNTQYGSYTIDAEGNWRYELDNDNPAVNALNDGGTLADKFTVYTEGGTPQEVTIAINGANDAAEVTGATSGSVTEDGATGPGTPAATGKLTATDVDNDDGFRASSGNTQYGSYTIDAEGNWRYELDNDNADVEVLDDGQTLTDEFTVLTRDGTQQTVTITINGADDTAIVAGDIAGAVTEVGVDVAGIEAATGQLTSTDNAFAPSSGATLYGSYSIDAEGNWRYELDNDNTDVDALNDGQTLEDTFTVRSTTGTAQEVTITINGANDAAVVTGATSGSVTEDGVAGPGTPGATGKLIATDVDNDDGFRASSGNAQYGSYTIDAEGNWRYDLDNDNVDVEALDDGQMLTDEFTVLTRDGTQQTVTITINGADDTAIVAGDIAGAVTEVGVDVAGIEAATGQLTSTDNAFAPSSGATLYGSYSIDAEGNWRYELDNDNADVDALNDGQTLEDTFTVRSTTGTAQEVTITVHGANDAAVVTGATSGSVTEDGATGPGTPTATGKLIATDVDNDDGFRIGSGDTQYGSYTIDAEGNWRYDLDNANPAVEVLNDGQTLTDEFTILTRDGTQQTVTITINGADDPLRFLKQAPWQIELVSRGTNSAQGNLNSTNADISSDGRFVVFQSEATNLLLNDRNGTSDVFLKDTQTGQLKVLSTARFGASATANGTSINPVISGDGKYVAFQSTATNIVSGSYNSNIYINNAQSGQTTAPRDGQINTDPAISDNGVVALRVDPNRINIFDIASGSFSYMDERGASGNFLNPDISADGRYVAWEITQGGQNNRVVLAERENIPAGFLFDVPGSNPRVSENGEAIVFERKSSDGLQTDVVVARRSVGGGIDEIVVTAGANGSSYSPDISRDGRYVTFESDASNLVPDDTNQKRDIFVKDLQTGQITRVTPPDGNVANGDSYAPRISDDGRSVVFHSEAFNLVHDDFNGPIADVFKATGGGESVFQAVITEDPSVSFFTRSGDIYFQDPDVPEGHILTIIDAEGNVGSIQAAISSDPGYRGIQGQLNWEYSVAGDRVEALGVGETKVETFTLRIDNGAGSLAETEVNIVLVGLA